MSSPASIPPVERGEAVKKKVGRDARDWYAGTADHEERVARRSRRGQSFVSVAGDETFADSDVALAVLVSAGLPSPALFSLDMAFLRDSEG